MNLFWLFLIQLLIANTGKRPLDDNKKADTTVLLTTVLLTTVLITLTYHLITVENLSLMLRKF